MSDLSRTKVRDYDVMWGLYPIGYVDKVDPTGLKLKTKPIKVGTLGDIELGERIIGLEGVIKVEVRELDDKMLGALTPWNSQAGVASPASNGAGIALLPLSFHKDIYDYAQKLVLHPTDMGSNLSQDLVLRKTVPMITTLGEADGVADNKAVIEFKPFPDRTKATGSPPLADYGYWGGTDPNP